jgi:DNA polymerase III epsilon subunit-like protein
MIILTFDTETSGLPPYKKTMCLDNLDLWPYVMQLSYSVFNTKQNDFTLIKDEVIKIPECVLVSEVSIKLHGITKEISQLKGIQIYEALSEFFNHLKKADKVVGHNVKFDIDMLRVESLRIIWENRNKLPQKAILEAKHNLHYLTNLVNIYCTMENSIDLCNIQTLDRFGKPYTKWPKLSELHFKLFGTNPNHLHNSLVDVLVTLRCFMMLSYNMDLNETCDNFKTTVSSLGLL